MSVNQDQKKILVIFGATQVDISQSLDQIRACIEGGYDIFVILSDVAGKIIQIDEIRDICGTDRVIIDSDLVDLGMPLFDADAAPPELWEEQVPFMVDKCHEFIQRRIIVV